MFISNPFSNAYLSSFAKSTPFTKSINIYGFDSISSIVCGPNFLYIVFAFAGLIPKLSKKPTICHNSQFSTKHCAISIAFSLVIPFICVNFSGSNLNTFIVSSPNVATIFLAVAGPIPFIVPFDKYFSNESSVFGITFSKVSTLNCFPYSLCVTKFPITLI